MVESNTKKEGIPSFLRTAALLRPADDNQIKLKLAVDLTMSGFSFASRALRNTNTLGTRNIVVDPTVTSRWTLGEVDTQKLGSVDLTAFFKANPPRDQAQQATQEGVDT
jgi:hypothetical protein